MRLSEAIRLGAMLKPKADGFFYSGGATCAQGAALDAIGHDVTNVSGCRRAFDRAWPWATVTRVACPQCGAIAPVNETVGHLNNGTQWIFHPGHDWPREQIAEWVESIEQQAGAKDSAAPSVESQPVGRGVENRI